MADLNNNTWDDDNAEQDFEEDEGPGPAGMKLTRELGLTTLAARLMLDAALRNQPTFYETSRCSGMVSVIQVPDALWGSEIAVAWRILAGSSMVIRRTGVRASDMVLEEATHSLSVWEKGQLGRPAELLAIGPSTNVSKNNLQIEFRGALKEQRAVHALSHAPESLLPAEVLRAADQRLVVPRIESGLLLLLAVDVCSAAADPIEPIPDELIRHLQPSDLILSRRPGQSVGDLFRRIQVTIQARQKPSGPGLESLPGMGQALAWAHRVVEDLQACVAGDLPASELDRGCVLEGPPGCGKTSLARAIAASARVPFVAASLQEWQGARDGHLGTLLGAMGATFAEARRLAPCVFLVDELDSFGDRSRFDARHRDYSRQVLNAFLEHLDGSHARDGVIVIGATNDASVLDPAILRPGRLEQIIRVPLPDADGLTLILRHHLRGELQGDDLLPLGQVAHERGASGADIERWCRVARATARRARRPMVLDDLVAEVGEPPPPLSPGDLERAAVHEAGHALGYLRCGKGVLLDVEVGLDGSSPGRTRTMSDALDEGSVFITQDAIHRRLRALLAGRAAELEILGDISGGAGGSSTSDLARATRLAVIAVAALGLDDHVDAVIWHRLETTDDGERLLASDPAIRLRVANWLSASMASAMSLVAQNRVAVLAVADALVTRGRLNGDEVARLVEQAATKGVTVNQGAREKRDVDPHRDGGHVRGQRRSRADG